MSGGGCFSAYLLMSRDYICLLWSRYFNSNRICNDLTSLLHDAKHRGELELNVLLSLLQLWFHPSSHPFSFLIATFHPIFLVLIPRLLFTSISLPLPVPMPICPPIITFSPAKCWAARVQEVILNLIPAAAASSSSSSSVYLMSTLISCSDPFINVLWGAETSISILKYSRCLAINPPGAAVMLGSLCMCHIYVDCSVYGPVIKWNNAHFDPCGQKIWNFLMIVFPQWCKIFF